MRHFDRMKVPYRVIVEEQEYSEYARVIDSAKLLVLDKQYQRDYDTCDRLGDTKSKGSGAARNFGWDHSISLGAKWHWMVDDNIGGFCRLFHNRKIRVGDGTIFRCMEEFVLRFKNIAMAGPHYRFFAEQNAQRPPFTLNSRIFSCNLIRNDVPFRWRARYNEDLDLSLRMLKAGWCTILFNAFLQNKLRTQSVKGGNTDELYREGTLAKSRMIVSLHPDVARLARRYGRWHHYVDYRSFAKTKLLRRDDAVIPDGVDDYGMRLVEAVA
jgi:hypothetical protein